MMHLEIVFENHSKLHEQWNKSIIVLRRFLDVNPRVRDKPRPSNNRILFANIVISLQVNDLFVDQSSDIIITLVRILLWCGKSLRLGTKGCSDAHLLSSSLKPSSRLTLNSVLNSKH
jgi:hypothetical protein